MAAPHNNTVPTAMAEALTRAFSSRLLLTTSETARLLGISYRTLADHVSKGRIGFVVVGSGVDRPRRRFSMKDVALFVHEQERVMPKFDALPGRGHRRTRRAT